MEMSLTGKRALVCGSTQGIGKAVALQLAALGAEVVLVARNEDKLKSVIKELACADRQEHHYICVDFAFPEKLRKKVEEFLKQNGAVHILVNNTGGPPAGSALEARTEDYVDAFKKHLICNQILAQLLVPGMKDAGYGRIINIISTSVKQPIAGLGVSNTIRGAVANWAKTLSHELGEFGITVNNVLPGFTRTERLASLIRLKAQEAGKSISSMEQSMTAQIPARRFADPQEIAFAAAFLASPAAAYINGINLPVDGGRTSSL